MGSWRDQILRVARSTGSQYAAASQCFTSYFVIVPLPLYHADKFRIESFRCCFDTYTRMINPTTAYRLVTRHAPRSLT